jgi:hypothetical protein
MGTLFATTVANAKPAGKDYKPLLFAAGLISRGPDPRSGSKRFSLVGGRTPVSVHNWVSAAATEVWQGSRRCGRPPSIRHG